VTAYCFPLRPAGAAAEANFGNACKSSASLFGLAAIDKEHIFMDTLRSSKASLRGVKCGTEVCGVHKERDIVDGGLRRGRDTRSASILTTAVYGNVDIKIRLNDSICSGKELRHSAQDCIGIERGEIRETGRRCVGRGVITESPGSRRGRFRTYCVEVLEREGLIRHPTSLSKKSISGCICSDKLGNNSLWSTTFGKPKDNNETVTVGGIVTSQFAGCTMTCYHSNLALLQSERTTL